MRCFAYGPEYLPELQDSGEVDPQFFDDAGITKLGLIPTRSRQILHSRFDSLGRTSPPFPEMVSRKLFRWRPLGSKVQSGFSQARKMR